MLNLVRLQCETCHGDFYIDENMKIAKCKSCGNQYFFKEDKSNDLIDNINIANEYLHRHDFDNAITHFSGLKKNHPNDPNVAWGLLMSTYGIVWGRDDRSGDIIPTCNRVVKESILDSSAYRVAISECADEQREIYSMRAAHIDRIQKKIKRDMEMEEDFDVFISFKAKNADGSVTEDSIIARRIYDELTQRGIKTFFSEVTLKGRIGDDYEPIIYRALFSCKFFILVATSEENINAVWVKNEWTRFRDRVQDEHLASACCTVFKNTNHLFNLPRMFQVQGVDLNKYPAGGYEIVLADNLSDKFGLTKKKADEEDAFAEQKKSLEQQQRILDEKIKEFERLAAQVSQSQTNSASSTDANNKTENAKKKPKQSTKAPASNTHQKPVILYQSTKQEFSKDEYSRGFKMFLQDAESGNSEAQFYVAVCYENGFGTRKLNQKALEWYEKSAAQGDTDANYYLGVIYESRLLGVKKEIPKAFEYYKKASDQGHPMAKRLVGMYYLDGIKSYLRRTAKNIAQGVDLLSELSANGDCEATKRLVKHYHRNSEYYSENEYLKWLRLAAEQGDADSQYTLAWICEESNNIEESIEWYQKAAEQKHFAAAKYLGELYEKRKDYENAIHWYNVDIEIGKFCYGSYCHLSWIYEHGLGVIRDDKKAALYRAKAEEKDAHSSANEFAKIREYYTNHERVMQSVNNVPYIKGSLRNIAKCAMLAITLGEISVVWLRVHLDIGYDSAKSILAQLKQLGYISQSEVYVKPFPSHKTLVSEDKFYRDLNNGVLGEIEK